MMEHANSIAGGVLAVGIEGKGAAIRIHDYQATYHGDADGVSFADGHSENYKYNDPRIKPIPSWDAGVSLNFNTIPPTTGMLSGLEIAR